MLSKAPAGSGRELYEKAFLETDAQRKCCYELFEASLTPTPHRKSHAKRLSFDTMDTIKENNAASHPNLPTHSENNVSDEPKHADKENDKQKNSVPLHSS